MERGIMFLVGRKKEWSTVVGWDSFREGNEDLMNWRCAHLHSLIATNSKFIVHSGCIKFSSMGSHEVQQYILDFGVSPQFILLCLITQKPSKYCRTSCELKLQNFVQLLLTNRIILRGECACCESCRLIISLSYPKNPLSIEQNNKEEYLKQNTTIINVS